MSKKELFIKQYKSLKTTLKRYWQYYGGLKAILKSPYFHISIIASLICIGFVKSTNVKWFDIALEVLPNLLGFTLGGYAIFLAFGDRNFFKVLSKRRNKEKVNKDEEELTIFLKVSGTFTHFIFIQSITIIFSIIIKCINTNNLLIAFVGFLLLIYSIFTALAAAFALLNIAYWYNTFLDREDTKDNS